MLKSVKCFSLSKSFLFCKLIKCTNCKKFFSFFPCLFWNLSFRIAGLWVCCGCFLACWRVQICPGSITAGILGFQLREEVGNAANGFGFRNVVQVEVLWRPIRGFRVQMEHIELFKNSRFNHLILPGDWNGAGIEPVIKWTIGGIYKIKKILKEENI